MGRFFSIISSVCRRVRLLTIFMCLFYVTGVAAEVRIDITRGNVEPLPIAISDIFGDEIDGAQIGRDIAGVISADLERSGLFLPIDSRAFLQDPDSLNARPRFSDWRVINAHALVNGKVKLLTDGQIRVEFRLWDVFAEAQMVGRAFLYCESELAARCAHYRRHDL